MNGERSPEQRIGSRLNTGVHHNELTYSVVLPRGHRLAARRLVLYRTIHTTLIEVLSDRGIAASLDEGSGRTAAGRQPFLCFQRRAPGDVLLGEAKIAGSAQRRSSGAVLQHGSVLLARSPAAPELDGLNDLAETPLAEGQLVKAWLGKLGPRLGLTWQDQPLSDPERRRVAELLEAKYSAEAWARSRKW